MRCHVGSLRIGEYRMHSIPLPPAQRNVRAKRCSESERLFAAKADFRRWIHKPEHILWYVRVGEERVRNANSGCDCELRTRRSKARCELLAGVSMMQADYASA
jgi:hypothetical protein